MAGARTPIFAVAVYLTLVAIALVVGLSGACCGEQGIWATILTLPWSILTVVVLDAIDPQLIGRVGALAMIPGALVNAVLVYWLARSWARRGDRANVESPAPVKDGHP